MATKRRVGRPAKIGPPRPLSPDQFRIEAPPPIPRLDATTRSDPWDEAIKAVRAAGGQWVLLAYHPRMVYAQKGLTEKHRDCQFTTRTVTQDKVVTQGLWGRLRVPDKVVEEKLGPPADLPAVDAVLKDPAF